jgi:hypothetical protein
VVVIPPEHQGAAVDHAAVWDKMNRLHGAGKMPAIGYYDHFPELATVISGRACPGLDRTVRAGEKHIWGSAQGAHLNPLGLFLCTSIPCIWSILSACLPSS